VFVYRLDEEQSAQASGTMSNAPKADAVTRPSKPYLPPDRGFGHEGFAAITMSYKNAQEFCNWLSIKSGKRYRLPTEDEWELACTAGSNGSFSFGNDVRWLSEYAWYKDNADGVPHEVGKKKPNAWGVFDMHGNVAEWVTGRDGQPVLKGGSYRDSPEKLNVEARMPNDSAWNASDPQIPKSQWWLADGPFVGFRIVCVEPIETAGAGAAKKSK
jgi:formylglycine-generating enzyme required for sulfatase activity